MKQPVIELSKQVTDARYFSFSRQGGRSRAPVDIIFGGLERCSEDYSINRKGFPVHLLEYVVEGSGSVVLQDQEHPLRKGCLYLYGPGIPCKILNSRQRPLVKHFFAFHCNGPSLQKLYKLDRLFFGANRGGERVADLINLLFTEACSATEDSWRICCSYLDIILLKCARSGLMEQHYQERAFQVFRKVKEHIEDNYLELRQMDDIAAAVDLDASYISRLFKRYYHLTPYNFLLKRKMEHALDILRQGNTSVREAALSVGFEDPFHFSRVFKKFKGVSPSHIRHQGL
jgi:AraC-like DNA-binding protein